MYKNIEIYIYIDYTLHGYINCENRKYIYANNMPQNNNNTKYYREV